MTPKTFIFIPTSDGCITAQTFISLWTFCRDPNVYLDKIRIQNYDLSRVRARAVRDFIDSDADILWFVDSDVSFDQRIPSLLLASGHDYCFAPYPKKLINWSSQRCEMHGETPFQYGDPRELHKWTFIGRDDSPSPNPDGFVPVKFAPLGCTMMSRKMLLALVPHVRTFTDVDNRQIPDMFHLQYDTMSDGREALLPEDYSFSKLAREHGFEPMMLLESCAHTGPVTIDVAELPKPL